MYQLAPVVGVSDAGAASLALLPYAERDDVGIVAGTAAAAWGSGRGSGHEHLSPPCSAFFGGSPIALTLLATNKTLVVLVPTIHLCFHPSGVGTLAFVVFVCSIVLQLDPRSSHRSSVTRRCRLPAYGITGLNHSLVPSLLVYDVEPCVGVMHYEIEPHLPLHLVANLEWLYSRCIASTSTLPCCSVYCRPPGITTSATPLSAW